jgi:hypothetical protein
VRQPKQHIAAVCNPASISFAAAGNTYGDGDHDMIFAKGIQ